MMKALFNWGMFAWLVVLCGLGYGIGFLFGHPLIGMSIGFGILVFIILLMLFVGWMMVWGAIKMFEGITNPKYPK